MAHYDEMLDIVDVNDCVIESLPRSLVYQKNLCAQMRSVWLVIKNDEGKIWIPRRNWNLSQLPGYLDGSVVGHVRAGETYEQALIRESEEEIGHDLTGVSYKLLGKLTPQQHQSFCFASVYECVMSEEPKNWNRDDICEWSWMSPQEILTRFDQGEKIKDTLLIVIKQFYTK